MNPKSKCESKCEKCGVELDEGENICCTCLDDTEGRNHHFWNIKNEC